MFELSTSLLFHRVLPQQHQPSIFRPNEHSDWSEVGALILNDSARFKCACGLIGSSLLYAAGQHHTCDSCSGARCWEPDRSERRISSIQIPISFSGEKKDRNTEMHEEIGGLVSLSALPSGQSPW